MHGEGMKFFNPSNMLDLYTRLEILLEVKLFGHTYTLTEASYLKDDIYKRSEIQNKQQSRNALDKLHANEMESPSKL